MKITRCEESINRNIKLNVKSRLFSYNKSWITNTKVNGYKMNFFNKSIMLIK